MTTENASIILIFIFSGFNIFFSLVLYSMISKDIRYLDKKIHEINLNSYKINK